MRATVAGDEEGIPIRSWLKEQLRVRPSGFLEIGMCLAWLGTAIACARPTVWPLELANHLHVVYLAALVPVAVIAVVRRRVRPCRRSRYE